MNIIISLNQLNEVIEGCRQKNFKQQELLYRTFAHRMLGVCMRYASDRSEAEDILQTGFIKVFGKIDTYQNKGPVEGWIRKIMVNTGIEYYRKRQRALPLSDIENESFRDPVYSEGTELEVKDLLKLVQQLPSNYRTAFTLHAIEGYSHKEISVMLDITELASRANLCRAREILKKHLQNITVRETECLAC